MHRPTSTFTSNACSCKTRTEAAATAGKELFPGWPRAIVMADGSLVDGGDDGGGHGGRTERGAAASKGIDKRTKRWSCSPVCADML